KMSGILYLDCLSDQHKQASELRKLYRKKARRSRKYNARYIKVPVWYNNSRLNLFFVRLGSGGKCQCNNFDSQIGATTLARHPDRHLVCGNMVDVHFRQSC
ncbi:MAG: hypothetical protein R6U58_09005, partial [Bacteroidales bacterium]